MVPIKDEEQRTAGSIEIYMATTGNEQERDGDFVGYWLGVYERYASLIGVGIKNFMVALINNLSIQASMLQNELNFEMSAFIPSQLQSISSGLGHETPIKFTELVHDLDLMAKKAFRADQCRVIFLPYKHNEGIILEGPQYCKEMSKVELEDTLVAKIIENPGCS